MFNTVLEYRYVNNKEIEKEGQLVKEHKLAFSCKGHKYIVNVEEYKCGLFALKFHLQAHRLSANKYKLLTGKKSSGPVIRTCIQIMLDFYSKKNTMASFIIVGENGINESEHSTRRFKIYSDLMENLFSPVSFWHYRYQEKSVYLLLNRNQSPELLFEIENLVTALL